MEPNKLTALHIKKLQKAAKELEAIQSTVARAVAGFESLTGPITPCGNVPLVLSSSGRTGCDLTHEGVRKLLDKYEELTAKT